MAVSPNLVNLVGIGLVVLLPSVIMLAWVHGKPGKDTWGRTPKVILSANILAMFMLLGFLFRGQDLGAITKTIEVQNENGAVSERVVPKNQFRHRVLLFYPENIGPESDNWARETLNTLQTMDLNQDVFVETAIPMNIVGLLKDVGSEDGFGLSSTDIEAVKSHVQGLLTVNFENNWERSAPLFDDAVAIAMENLFRVTERTRFMIKAQYYFNVKQDSDKSIAILNMWSQIYPNDVDALSMMALFSYSRQDLHTTIDSYKKFLDIDPSKVNLIRRIASWIKHVKYWKSPTCRSWRTGPYFGFG